MKEFETYTLSNGIRGIHRQVRSGVTHCAMVVNAGSRDEQRGEYGIAHFVEHALFKGTAKRKAHQVNCRLENLGGELNAFTTKEDTTLHATVMRHDFSRAVELIGDVIFRSTFPEHELKKEREVIADEINSYKDSPSERIYDDFEDMIFRGSELGHNILGSKASIARFDSEAIKRYVARCYTTDQMVFSSIGNFSVATARSVAERYLASFAPTKREFKRVAPLPYEAFDVCQQVLQTLMDGSYIVFGNDAGIAQHLRMGQRALNILLIHPLIKADGGIKIIRDLLCCATGSTSPHLCHSFLLCLLL